VQQVGEPLELYGAPLNRFVAGFIGSPAMNFVGVAISDSGGVLWAEAEGLRLKVPPQLVERVRPHTGKRATLGMRPEALHPVTGADPAEYCFDTTVDVVEPLGNEILVNFRAGGAPMVARVDPAVRVKAHQAIRLALDPERVHFFDENSGAAI
jgi:multiple sugar transport system ATP-binding protein